MGAKRYPEWFREWQTKFYNGAAWRKLRDHYRASRGMRCEDCGKLIRGKSVVDHVEEVTPRNHDDPRVTLNPDNLRLLCLECHNRKTFGEKTRTGIWEGRSVNLF
jgi:5-methylcytosine-specific restriction endonuclease McrA